LTSCSFICISLVGEPRRLVGGVEAGRERGRLRLSLANLLVQRGDLLVERAAVGVEEGALARDVLGGLGVAQLGRHDDRRRQRRLGARPRTARLRSAQRVLLQRELGVGAQVADDEERIAGADALPFADEDLADDAAFLVLHGLAVQLDLDLRRCDHRAGDRRGPRPGRDRRRRSRRGERPPVARTCGRAMARRRRFAGRARRRGSAVRRRFSCGGLRWQGRGRRPASAAPARLAPTSCGSTADGGVEGDDGTVLEDGDLVEARHQRRPVADDDDRRAALLQRPERGAQRVVALGIEVGVGLVEDDEARLAVQARARAMRWRCPPDRREPPSPTGVS
jgi:hypothetical protein